MEQPQGYENVKHPRYVCKLKKALYGLKQAPRAWHARIVAYLVAIGFHMVDADRSLYVRKNENGIVIVCIYVNDLIIGGDNEGEIMHRQYALDMLSKYGMGNFKPISMPLDQNVKLRADEDQVLEDVTMYRQIVGSLIYLTIGKGDLYLYQEAVREYSGSIQEAVRKLSEVIRSGSNQIRSGSVQISL
ncbi:hypothetical protein L7F22_060959 [Adiantum nelumboides]|nr:hypothetical protein [Adiantum nelumboides]